MKTQTTLDSNSDEVNGTSFIPLILPDRLPRQGIIFQTILLIRIVSICSAILIFMN